MKTTKRLSLLVTVLAVAFLIGCVTAQKPNENTERLSRDDVRTLDAVTSTVNDRSTWVEPPPMAVPISKPSTPEKLVPDE